MGEGCGCTRFFVDCEEAERLYNDALTAYLEGREQWGNIMAIYYTWHKRRAGEAITADNA